MNYFEYLTNLDIYDILKIIIRVLLTLGMYILIIGLIVLALLIFFLVCNILLFNKCNKPGWAAIIPFYHNWVKCEIVGCHWIVFIGLISPTLIKIFHITAFGSMFTFVSIFAYICICYNLSKKFNKGVDFCIGIILLPIVFIPILALSKKCKYDEKIKVKNCAFFDVNF